MNALEQKYLALLNEAERRKLPDLDSIRLCFQALSLASAIDRDCAALLAPHGLSEGRFVLLFLLDAAQDGLAPNTLAQQAGVTRATVTGLLDGLEREALIERHADATDRRALTIRLTRKGKQVASKVFDEHGRWIASLFGDLSVQERSMLGALLRKVSAGMAKRGGGLGDPA
ncbi:MarR family transcriptional regulator [Cupriavidus basilensis]|uniref:MarR family transcriptional regulator n=1 Tax=Cupriavidus basilensis TaxID=68895 RepID=A0ABT6AQU9_9BURK|nr:MarR family transcriptional regulator [Cupriavidus basilensis]MDF3834963.1 MarR family transcriptional regulator [Cupriavidus basilensis]